MKLRKFNESLNEDPNIGIIRDAFYNITDNYPDTHLLIKKDDTFNWYVVNLIIKCDMKNVSIKIKTFKDIINAFESSLKYLEINFTIDDFEVMYYSEYKSEHIRESIECHMISIYLESKN